MPELVTMGETMAAFTAGNGMPLRYAGSFNIRTAGAESNLAVGMAKLGHSSGWISRLGDDEFGEYILRELRGEGVDCSAVGRDADRPTGIMFKQTREGSETKVFYYRKGSAASAISPLDIDEEYLKGARIVHITGITPALSPSCAAAATALADAAKKRGILLSFDPNLRLKLWTAAEARAALDSYFSRADIVLLGMDEASALLGAKDEADAIGILRNRGAAHIALKLGGRGAVVADRETMIEVPIYPAAVVDPIGAGDAFDAGFLAGLLEGKGLADRGAMGSLMGALAVSTKGDVEGLVGRAEFDRLMAKQSGVAR